MLESTPPFIAEKDSSAEDDSLVRFDMFEGETGPFIFLGFGVGLPFKLETDTSIKVTSNC